MNIGVATGQPDEGRAGLRLLHSRSGLSICLASEQLFISYFQVDVRFEEIFLSDLLSCPTSGCCHLFDPLMLNLLLTLEPCCRGLAFKSPPQLTSLLL